MKKFVFSILFMLSIAVQADSTVSSTQIRTQYAGQIGFMAVGFGAEFREYITLDLFYGIVPAEIGGQKIETVALKNNYRLTTFQYARTQFSPYLGLGIFHVLGSNYQTSRDNSFPTNYYQEASLRGLFYAGMQFGSVMAKENSVYFEMGINDMWVENYYNNADVLDPKDHVSLAMGWSYHFR